MPQQNLTGLKTLVISMGVMLVVGFFIVMAAIWMKTNAPLVASKGTLPANCAGGAVDLKGRGQMIDTSVEGNIMRIALTRTNGEIEMLHIDVCTGKEIGVLKISVDAPPAPPAMSTVPDASIQ